MKIILALMLLLIFFASTQAQEFPLESVSSLSDKVTFSRITASIDDRGRIEISGEVLNETLYEIYFVRTRFNLKDADGAIIEQDYAFASGETIRDIGSGISTEVIEPGKTGFFEETVSDEDVIAATVSFSASIAFDKQVESIKGDIDNDGDVDLQDFFIFADNFGKRVTAIASKAVANSAIETLEKENASLRFKLRQADLASK